MSLFLKKISLLNYKNIEEKTLDLEAKINCLVGKNGVGKSNILDAIYLLAFGKSYFNKISLQNIQNGKSFYMVEGEFERNNNVEKINCSIKKGQKKILKRNGKPYEKISEHIGLFPLVIISPSDSDLINEGSATRRKFIDSIIGQINKEYLSKLIEYNRVLLQRNTLLKQAVVDEVSLEIYNEQLVLTGNYIYEKRKEFLMQFIPIFESQYESITQNKENVSIDYQSHLLENSFSQQLQNSIKKDMILQNTSKGIHKDDLIFCIDKQNIKRFGSQGQQKSFLIALRLAQFNFLSDKYKNITPLVLLDDIFDKLDSERVAQLIHLVKNENFGQVFISDTDEDRINKTIQPIGIPYKIIQMP